MTPDPNRHLSLKSRFVLMAAFALIAFRASTAANAGDSGRIQPYSENPFYWQYKGAPVLLLGGSDDDNLFQWSAGELKVQLALMVSAGANYVRNTMSARDEGNVQAFAKTGDRYDLTRWNETYWTKFQNFLRLTAEYGVFVQIEIWDPHDFHRDNWERNPWNPVCNTTFPPGLTQLKASYGSPMHEANDFFRSVPALDNNQFLLTHQRRFVERVLSIALEYDHVLYCMDNEIHPLFSPEWGWYWASLARSEARKSGKRIETSEMFWQTDFTHQELRASLDRPETYSFFEASQNSANSGQLNWDYLQHVRGIIKATHPRPINNTKVYGADTGPAWAGGDREAEARFWRNIFGGSASSRFHRPPIGLGAGTKAMTNVRSIRMLTGEMNLFACEPRNDLLSGRAENQAYCIAEPGRQYAVYFPDGGTVWVDVSGTAGTLQVHWLNIAQSAWLAPRVSEAGAALELKAPGPGQWAALVLGKPAPGAR